MVCGRRVVEPGRKHVGARALHITAYIASRAISIRTSFAVMHNNT